MNSVTFLNPLLLWGLGLVSIPIIIHFLFRRRFRRVEWAPMKYLKLTIQRNRRRIQIEQLILLLLRMALIGILFLLVARPVVHLAGLGSWLGSSSRISKMVVLDDSLSMGVSTSGQSAFQRARELVSAIAREVGPHDRFTLVLASRPKEPLLHEVESLDQQQVSSLLETLKPADSFVAWTPTMSAVDELVSSSTYPERDVTLITDLRRAGWEQSLQDLAERWAGERVRLRIFNVGAASTRQLTIESLKAEDSVAVVGTPARWDAVVHNGSDQSLEQVEATVLIDGKPNAISLPPLPAGQSVHVPLTATFQEAGLHHFSLRLPDDDLPADNQHWNVVDVRDNRHVVLVDGQPSSEPLAGAVDFLIFALTSGGGDFQVDTLTDIEPGSLANLQPDLLMLADVASITPQQAQRLRTLVEAGMGLVLFVGDQVDPDNYNQVLRREGVDLLPTALERVDDEGATGLLLEDNAPSSLDALRQLSPAVLSRIRTKKFFHVALPADAKDVRVLARWNNSASSPAAVEKVVGRGRVVLWTTTANKAWTDWPVGPAAPSFVLAMRESAKVLSRREAGARDIPAGESLRHPLAAEAKIRTPMIETPGSDKPKPLAIETADDKAKTDQAAKPTELSLTFADTYRAGLYRMNWQADPGGAQTDLFAVNPDVRESNLANIDSADLKSLWGSLEPEVISAAGATQSVDTRGDEVWRQLAMCMLALVAVEACFATWAGRQR
jgi:hypothetical protein